MDIVIPDLGDIDEVEVIELCVAEGDVLETDDPIIVIESDKASMEIPSPGAGVLESLSVSVGDTLSAGAVIGKLKQDNDAPEAEDQASVDDTAVEQTSGGQEAQDASGGETDSHSGEASKTPANQAPSAGSPAASDDSEQTIAEILVPDIGDATGVVVIEIAVKTGDVINKDDLLVVLESDKASMEIASEYDGKVLSVDVTEGDEVAQDSLIAKLEVTASAASKQTGAQGDTTPTEVTKHSVQKGGEDQPSGPSADDEASNKPSPSAPSTSKEVSANVSSAELDASKIYAGPAVRKLARELGVSLAGIKGSGSRGRITKDDVKAYVKDTLQKSAGEGGGLPQVPEVDFTKFGDVEIVPLTRIQQRGADNLHRSWVNVPHVTQHDEVDVTDLEAFRKSLKGEAESRGVKVTPLSFLVKACCNVLRQYPVFNASIDRERQNLAVKKYINIGIAVDTPEGLVVPVIKAADEKSIWELSAEIAELSAKARDKKLSMDNLQGGTFSISSLGALGGTGFTPIVNAPEVAILGVAKMQTKPLWDGEGFQPRKVLPLSLSYDHRVVNGADGGRFMLALTSILADIRRLAL